MEILRSPLSYQGSKFSLIKPLRSIIPNGNQFVDVFGGSGTVSINMLDKFARVMHNDHDVIVSDVLETLGHIGYKDLVIECEFIIDKFTLNRHNELGFYQFRKWYNDNYSKSPDKGSIYLWILSKGSFSSLIRFCQEGKFNMSFGKRALSKAFIARAKFEDAINRLDRLEYVCYSWEELLASDGCTYYLDPPYTASGTNNYFGQWDAKDDAALFKRLNRLKSPWYLSNVFEHGLHSNKLLKKFAARHTVYYFDKKYGLRSAGYEPVDNTVEVLITNQPRVEY